MFSHKREPSDLDFYVGSFFFAAWAALVVGTPVGGLSLSAMVIRLVVAVALLAISYYFLRTGLRGKRQRKPGDVRAVEAEPRPRRERAEGHVDSFDGQSRAA